MQLKLPIWGAGSDPYKWVFVPGPEVPWSIATVLAGVSSVDNRKASGVGRPREIPPGLVGAWYLIGV
jgi:hypothetical protein